jgi:hypothetical protein
MTWFSKDKEPDIVVGVKANNGKTYYLGAYEDGVVSVEAMKDFLKVQIKKYLMREGLLGDLV